MFIALSRRKIFLHMSSSLKLLLYIFLIEVAYQYQHQAIPDILDVLWHLSLIEDNSTWCKIVTIIIAIDKLTKCYNLCYSSRELSSHLMSADDSCFESLWVKWWDVVINDDWLVMFRCPFRIWFASYLCINCMQNFIIIILLLIQLILIFH